MVMTIGDEGTLAWKQARLADQLGRLPHLWVAYSGGVDSAFLMHVAHGILGARCQGVLADSASLPRREREDALALARSRGWNVRVIETNELNDPRYAANPLNRCYFCKAELFARMDALAQSEAARYLAYGENADDALDVRPGRLAADEFRVLAPLREAGLRKAEIRALSRAAGLPTSEKPAAPCLSSRVATGQPVTAETLGRVEAAEEFVRAQGFRVVRVRHVSASAARVLVGPDETPMLLEAWRRDAIETALQRLGYATVEFDPAGYQGPSLR
jgi:uncharacterized protein